MFVLPLKKENSSILKGKSISQYFFFHFLIENPIIDRTTDPKEDPVSLFFLFDFFQDVGGL